MDWEEFLQNFCVPREVSLSGVILALCRMVDAMESYRKTAVLGKSCDVQSHARSLLAIKTARAEIMCLRFDSCAIPSVFLLSDLAKTALRRPNDWTCVVGSTRQAVMLIKNSYFVSGNVDSVLKTALKEKNCCE